MHSEKVIVWDYIDFLLENLSLVQGRDSKFIRTVESADVSDSTDTFHALVKIEGFFLNSISNIKKDSFSCYLNYYSKDGEILSPHVEISQIKNFLEFLYRHFKEDEIKSILIKIKSIQKSDLKNRPVEIRKIKVFKRKESTFSSILD